MYAVSHGRSWSGVRISPTRFMLQQLLLPVRQEQKTLKRSYTDAVIASILPLGTILLLSMLMTGCGGSGSGSSSGGSTAVSHNIDLTWTGDVSASGYIVYRRSASSISSVPLNTVPLTTTSFTDIATSGSRLLYRVTAVDANGFESVPSEEVSVTVP
jgi:hypothetical protein